MVGKKKAKERGPSIRVPREQFAWAEEHVQNSDGAFRSVSDLYVHTMRLYRESDQERAVRRALFDAWTASGRKWPPPPGLMPPGMPFQE
jgi:Arc/MetJ-type ribon-helix-helix transcriptional regulator